MKTTQGSRESTPESLEAFLAEELDTSVESLQEKAGQISIEAPWNAEVVEDHE